MQKVKKQLKYCFAIKRNGVIEILTNFPLLFMLKKSYTTDKGFYEKP